VVVLSTLSEGWDAEEFREVQTVVTLQGLDQRTKIEEVVTAPTSRRLKVVVQTRLCAESWAEIANKLSRGVRPSVSPQLSIQLRITCCHQVAETTTIQVRFYVDFFFRLVTFLD